MTSRSVSLTLAAAVLLAASASLTADCVRAQEVEKRASPQAIPYKQETSFADQLIAVGLALAVVAAIGAIGIGGYRYLTGARPGSPARRLKVLETLRLSPRTVLFLVEFDRRTLLIGQHGDRLTLLVGSAETATSDSRDSEGKDHAGSA